MTRRFSYVAQGVALIGAAAGVLATLGVARAADANATGSIVPASSEGAEWWRLRPSQAPGAEVGRGEAKGDVTPLPEARKAVRIVYPAPYAR